MSVSEVTDGHQAPLVLVVDDEASLLLSLRLLLINHGLGPVKTLNDSREVMPFLKIACVAVLLLDMRMPYVSGMELLVQVKAHHPYIPVIMVTALQDVDTAVECMKNGAADYLIKPVEVERLIAAVRKAKELVGLRLHADTLKDYLLGGNLKHPEAFEGIVTRSQKMFNLFKYLESAVRTGEPLLIHGETGTGKELFAQAFHVLRRVSGPLVAVNVAGLDDHLFADTLFGHTKGAFTGAQTLREGLVTKAARGTLFLDEIGDLSESSQVKLLRLLQEKKFEPLGSDVSRNADITIVAATNRDLKQRIQAEKFRADLYYRLSTHAIVIPPLRERQEDLPLLLDRFITEVSRTIGLHPPPVPPPQLVNLLECYVFPGNVRELRSMVMDAVAHHTKGVLSLETFKRVVGQEAGKGGGGRLRSEEGLTKAPLYWPSGERPPTLKEAESYLIGYALEKSRGNQGIAASMLGLTRQALNQRIARRGNPSLQN
ncbi:MAG: sigma-54-dependent Fis family transcriptional regulator [Magnetococcales bacterium]|nr:sigma-54-dependent Fis family transcriptional regulator [Magnetococcales bacterium]